MPYSYERRSSISTPTNTETEGTSIMSYSKTFRIKPGSKVDLSKIDAGYKDQHESHKQALPEIEAYDQKL